MKSAVFLASIVFWLALFNATTGLLNSNASVIDAVWITITLFWLRLEVGLAFRNWKKDQQ